MICDSKHFFDRCAEGPRKRTVGRITMALAVAVALYGGPAAAHQASDAYLRLGDAGRGASLRIDIALRDLDAALDLDADADGRLTWGEVRTAWPAIEAYVQPRVQIPGCGFRPTAQGLERRADGVYATLSADADCRLGADPVIRYTLLAEVDPTHRGIARLDVGNGPAHARVLDPTRPSPVAPAPRFVAEGVRHILTGFDHVLFLLCLLLPAAMFRARGGPWRPVESLRQALLPLAGIVTAFTLAHSLTLALAATKVVSLPPAFVEPAIAVTIMLAATDNLRPLLGHRPAAVAFVFGLVHGFGFAGVLAELDLPAAQFAWALLQFNLGLELGQLAIVAAAVPVFMLRSRPRYAAWAIRGASLAALLAGGLWFVERTPLLS